MSEVFERVFHISECKTQSELGDLLGIRQSSVSDAIRRGNIPAEWLVTLLRLKSVNPEWILMGEGPVRLGALEDGAEGSARKIVYLPEYARRMCARPRNWLTSLSGDRSQG